MANEMMDAAVQYVRMGWSIFPIKPKSKAPATKHGVKDAQRDLDDTRELWTARPDMNIAIAAGAVSGDIVIIDIDLDPDSEKDGYETLREWEKEHGELPETVQALTPRGGCHMFYRVPHGTTFPNTKNEDLAVDVRSDGGYIVAPPSVHPNGGTYQWEHDPSEYAVADADANVLAFIEHVQYGVSSKSGKPFDLPEVIYKGARDDTLFKYACSLQAQGYQDHEIFTLVHAVNAQRCKPPLENRLVDAKVNSALNYEKGKPHGAQEIDQEEEEDDGLPQFRKGRHFCHDVMGDYLIGECGACTIEGAPACWVGDRYMSGYEGIHKAIVALDKQSTRANQNEVYNYLVAAMPAMDPAPPNLIAFNNGLYDMDTYELREYDKGTIITNVIPHAYNEDAYSEVADRFLTSISCGDLTIRANLEEVIGLCMWRNNSVGWAVCPILIGEGNNGKSTYLKALSFVLGFENVSSLDIALVGQRFQAGQLVGKLANIGDDISNVYITGDVLAIFKKMVTGERIYTDVKGTSGFDFTPYCTMIFSANEFPRLEDHSEGIMRRFWGIPFKGKFKRGIKGFDPNLVDKLLTEEAAEYFIQCGIRGLTRIRANQGMTPSKFAEEIVQDLRVQNDTVLQWLEDVPQKSTDIIGTETGYLYQQYKDWASESGVRAVSRRQFSARICKEYDLKSVPNHGRRVYASNVKEEGK